MIHILEDQPEHMGTNLFVPITRKRVPGLKFMHSAGDAPVPEKRLIEPFFEPEDSA